MPDFDLLMAMKAFGEAFRHETWKRLYSKSCDAIQTVMTRAYIGRKQACPPSRPVSAEGLNPGWCALEYPPRKHIKLMDVRTGVNKGTTCLFQATSHKLRAGWTGCLIGK